MAVVEHQKLGDMFPRSVFEIPKYQRGYSWTEREVNDLLEDIDYAYQERNNGTGDFTHYFGTIVLHDTGVVQGETDDFDKYHVIDGQQRVSTISIIVSTLIDEINQVKKFSLDSDHSVEPDRLAQDNRDDFISQHGTIRVRLDSINNETFERLVVYDDPIEEAPDDNLAQRRLIEAKQAVEDWFDEKRSGFSGEKLDSDGYYRYLMELGRTIRNALEVTTYIIEDETEAGRLFEVVNDRGRDLTTLDKIKSYLVYCSARQDDNQLANKVYRKVGEVIRNITKFGGTDDDLETFVNNHWIVFTGEINRFRGNPQYTEIHRRIKHLEKHAERNQRKSDIREWINAYLESLTACSEAFAVIDNPQTLNTENEVEEDIKSKLDAISQLPVSGNFYPLLMAAYSKYGLGQEFHNIVNLCEIFSFRVYNVGGRRTDAAGNPLRRHAYWIEWADKEEQAKSVFSGEEVPIHYNDEAEVVQETCRMLENQIGKHCPDTFFIKCLLRTDIFDGADENDGWTGVRNKSAISYLLYKYEKHMRKQGSKSNISQIPPFSKWRSEGITIEHVHPQNPEEGNSEIEGVVDSIGNLVLLGPEDNSGAGNSGYEEKYEEVYSKSSMEIVSELPHPDEGWSESQIRQRTMKITRFALNEWDRLSTAHIHVGDAPTDLDVTELAEVAHEVRTDYSSRHQFRVPSVKFQHEGVSGDEGWEIVNSCPKCDSTLVDLKSTDGWDAVCGGCGTVLDVPVYKFKNGDFVKLDSVIQEVQTSR